MWTVAPHVNPDAPVGRLKVNYLDSANFSFDHTREIVVSLNEEFLEHCTEGALSIEVRTSKYPLLITLLIPRFTAINPQ